MDKKCTMIGLKKEEEMELDLGLSIGRGFKSLEKEPNPIKNEPPPFQRTRDPKNSFFDTDLRDNHPSSVTDLELEKMVVDPQVKREIEALRRQEAKKKRQEKQQHKGMAKNEECINAGFGVMHDNKVWLKSPELETREGEFDVNERECKKSRVESRNYSMEMKNMNLNFTAEQNMNMNQNVTFSSNPTAFSSSAVYPVMYPYPPVQFVQFPNGLPYPCVNVIPFWANSGASNGNEQNVMQSLVNQSFRSYQSGQGLPVFNVDNGCAASDQNSRKAGSTGSPMCSSFVVSDYRSSFHEGVSSSDNKSHSIFSLPQPPLHGSEVNDTKGQSEHSASSHLKEAAQTSDETTNSIKPKVTSNNSQCSQAEKCASNCMEQKIPSNIFQFSSTKHEEGAAIESRPASENLLSTTENRTSGLLKESKGEIGKPPKPQMPENQNTPSLPQMPYVSITGNGPNGKTINGLLYRYTKTEVIIMCVCHGTSFSPAEFVQHAGGTDLSNPLKHITVIPSDF